MHRPVTMLIGERPRTGCSAVEYGILFLLSAVEVFSVIFFHSGVHHILQSYHADLTGKYNIKINYPICTYRHCRCQLAYLKNTTSNISIMRIRKLSVHLLTRFHFNRCMLKMPLHMCICVLPLPHALNCLSKGCYLISQPATLRLKNELFKRPNIYIKLQHTDSHTLPLLSYSNVCESFNSCILNGYIFISLRVDVGK